MLDTFLQLTAGPQTFSAQPATRWDLPGRAFWAGDWQQSDNSQLVCDPDSGAPLAVVADTTGDEMRRAVDAAARERDQGDAWPAWQRRRALHQASRILTERAELFASTIAAEGIKTIREARLEVARAAHTLLLSSEQAGSLTGHTLPFDSSPRGAGRLGWYSREPIGLVAALTPYNDPLNLVAHKLGPALVAGNVVVLKPAEATPIVALRLAEVLLEAGVPPGRISILPGGPEAGRALVTHDEVDLVSFTGGWRTGDAVARAAGAKKTMMELGGCSAVVVLADSDVNTAARAVAQGAFGSAGQNCISVQRVFVDAEVFGPFVSCLAEHAEALVVGPKDDPQTDIGPLISEREARRIEGWIAEAAAGGAQILTGMRRMGSFLWPTVLTGVPSDASLMTQEVFGPVVCVESVATVADAVRRVNENQYGLHAGVYTRTIDTALMIATQLRVGAVMINDTSDFRIDEMPFGGFKHSGVGREGVRNAVEAMTEPKVIALRLPISEQR
ncbi:aldehyde dehydrogenase family protein [Micromonospora sp. NPDC047707]|uniref:aldehyde dehydrogenase family protein n=1 Tax=Micromonospora sp. NPDC047707 TaxID=3154498 RepID=UPI0034514A56